MSRVGFLSEKKQLRLFCPQADKSSSVSYSVMDDEWWRKRGGGQRSWGLLWLKHIIHCESKPPGWVNPHLLQHTTSVTLPVPQLDFQVWGLWGRQLSTDWRRWEEASGGIAGQSKLCGAFWLSYDLIHNDFWSQTDRKMGEKTRWSERD